MNPTACFVAGTVVLTVLGQTAIEEIEVGDYVWASDPETGETAPKRVVQTFVNQSDELIHLTVNGETITTTPTHPFYKANQGWFRADSLRAGDILVTVNGEYVILEQVQHELLEAPITVHNFEVEDFHTYFVGDDDGVLVHNACQSFGKGHGIDKHKKAIDTKIKELVKSGDYDYVYGNRALKTAGLNGTERPDIIAIDKNGIAHIWEFASPSQASGKGLKQLEEKIKIMKSANPTSKFYDIIAWGSY